MIILPQIIKGKYLFMFNRSNYKPPSFRSIWKYRSITKLAKILLNISQNTVFLLIYGLSFHFWQNKAHIILNFIDCFIEYMLILNSKISALNSSENILMVSSFSEVLYVWKEFAKGFFSYFKYIGHVCSLCLSWMQEL